MLVDGHVGVLLLLRWSRWGQTHGSIANSVCAGTLQLRCRGWGRGCLRLGQRRAADGVGGAGAAGAATIEWPPVPAPAARLGWFWW